MGLLWCQVVATTVAAFVIVYSDTFIYPIGGLSRPTMTTRLGAGML